jgi:signal transduction histidine kinase/phage shock protein PspC (stress-responsive transcriptional regulator)
MTLPAAPPEARRPILYRSATDRQIGGVCGGLAAHLGLNASVVRVVFIVGTLALSGLGIILYLILWAVTPAESESLQAGAGAVRARAGAPSGFGPWHWLVVAGSALVLAGLVVGTPLGSIATNPRVLVPVLAVAAGAFVAWYQLDESSSARWPAGTRRRRVLGVLQVAAGLALATVGGIVLVTQREGLQGVWNGAVAAFAVLAGVVVIAAPFVLRFYRRLGVEQAERARATERADIAAHLHDSVLQTLALIQRRADDPVTVARLARRQERELRSWLYAGSPAREDSLAAAVTAVVHDVEDEHGVPVELVATGDRVVDEAGASLVKATREALLNAVRHGRAPVSVYLEVGADGVEVFVRDHGDGFDIDEIADDRLGVRESILGRMDRAGGRARIRRLEQGTEIELTLPPPSQPQPEAVGAVPASGGARHTEAHGPAGDEAAQPTQAAGGEADPAPGSTECVAAQGEPEKEHTP